MSSQLVRRPKVRRATKTALMPSRDLYLMPKICSYLQKAQEYRLKRICTMNEIICPNCSKAFKVDETGYANILQQVLVMRLRPLFGV